MFEALLAVPMGELLPVIDAIDIYEGSIPPSAVFQVIDVDNTTIAEARLPTGEDNVN